MKFDPSEVVCIRNEVKDIMGDYWNIGMEGLEGTECEILYVDVSARHLSYLCKVVNEGEWGRDVWWFSEASLERIKHKPLKAYTEIELENELLWRKNNGKKIYD